MGTLSYIHPRLVAYGRVIRSEGGQLRALSRASEYLIRSLIGHRSGVGAVKNTPTYSAWARAERAATEAERVAARAVANRGATAAAVETEVAASLRAEAHGRFTEMMEESERLAGRTAGPRPQGPGS